MDDNTSDKSGNVIKFQLRHGKKTRAGCTSAVAESVDDGPSAGESLRVVKAFLAIKDKKSRAGVIAMLERFSQSGEKTPGPLKR
jgi:hypothetical protein